MLCLWIPAWPKPRECELWPWQARLYEKSNEPCLEIRAWDFTVVLSCTRIYAHGYIHHVALFAGSALFATMSTPCASKHRWVLMSAPSQRLSATVWRLSCILKHVWPPLVHASCDCHYLIAKRQCCYGMLLKLWYNVSLWQLNLLPEFVQHISN